MSSQKRSTIGEVSNNPTVAAIAGAIVGAVVAALLTLIVKDVQYHDAVTYNNISSYIKSALVSPGLIGEDILEKSDPFQQIEMIGDVLGESNSQNEELGNSIRNFLITYGQKESTVNSYSTSELIASFNQEMDKINTIIDENADLLVQLEELQSQKLATLGEPKAYISGEPLDTTIKGYFATINAHNYYSEEFLNLFLPKQLVYHDNEIYYDKEAPERINLIDANLTYDVTGFDLCNGSSHFTMGLQDYNNGIRPNDSYHHLMNVACNGNYSQIEFTLGHVDNTRRDSRELIIYYMDNGGEFKEAATFSLYADMPIQTHSVPIYNTKTVQIVIPDSWYGDYALADIYLIK